MLSDEQKAEAKRLGLSREEARWSLGLRIPLTRYAEIKAQIAKEGVARQAQEVAGNEIMLERAAHFAPHVHGADRPGLASDDTSSENGD